LGSGSETQQKPSPVGEFCWNELLTSDEAAATKFYSAVFGWQTADFSGGGAKYTIWKSQGKGVGGLMKRPMENMPPHWMGYVTVADVDATLKKAGDAGGKVLMPALNVPTVGRIAVLQDPQGATLGIIRPQGQPTNCSANQIVWCDIPVKDLDRSIQFYSAVLGAPIKKEQHEGNTFAMLPHAEEHGVSGCLTTGCEGSKSEPSQSGPLLYFNCQGRLDQAIAAAGSNGGKVLQPKHAIGPYGFCAVVLDSEGNRIALHSM
jgi:predicted enzyme related to lactoylglutathione lyase